MKRGTLCLYLRRAPKWRNDTTTLRKQKVAKEQPSILLPLLLLHSKNNMSKQASKTVVKYKPLFADGYSAFKTECSLDTITFSGCYLVEVNHNSANAGFPPEECNEGHYVVGTLIVTDSGTDGPVQNNRVTGQVLILTSCKQKTTNVYSRTRMDDKWSDWRSLAATGMFDDISSTDELLATVESLVNENTRAKEVQECVKRTAVDISSLTCTADNENVTITGSSIDGQVKHSVEIPAATTDKAGVMSAEDKGRLEYQLIRLAGFSTANAVNSGDIVYNNNSSSSTYRKLRKYVGVINGVNTFEDVPFVDGAIYTYNDKLFTYNGTELIDVSSELRNAVSLLQGAVGENVSFYATYNSEVAVVGHYINDKGSIVSGANFGYTKPIKVSEGEILTVQGLGTGLPYYVWATETGEILSIGDVCPTIMERKAITLVKDGYIILNVRRVKASTVGAPYFCATISNGLLIEERLAKLGDNPIVNELKVDTGMSIKYIPNETDIAKTNAYISVNGSIASNEVVAYTKPIQVKEGDVLSVQGLGPGFPYYAYVNEAGAVLSIGDVCSAVVERKVMTLSQDGYIALNLRIKKSTNAAAPPFEAVISSKKLTKDLIQELYEPTRITGFAQKEYPNADIDKNECYVAFYNAMMKKCADYGIEGAVIGGPAGYGLESWNGIEIERGKSNVDIYGLIKILGLVYGDWRLVDMWGEYDNPTLSIPIMRGTSIVNQEISSTLGRSEYSYILTENYCVLAAKGGTHEGISVNYSAACTCDALKGNVVIGYVNTTLSADTDEKSRYRAFKCLMDIAVRKFEDRNSDVTSLENVLKGQMVQRAAAVIVPNTNPQLLHRLDFANSSYYKLYEYNPGMVDTMSTIKSLTTAVALDYINDMNTLVTVVQSDITDATGGTHPIFESGDKLTVRDLIYASSVRSSNQASYALARIIGQTILKNERL